MKKDPAKEGFKIVVSKDGPYLVSGAIPLDVAVIVTDNDGHPTEWGKGKSFKVEANYALCRCGRSAGKPFCDGSHTKGFNGSETASMDKYLDQAQMIRGPKLTLTDVPSLCSSARYCHAREGSTWELVEHSDNNRLKELSIKQACNCPSGRLVMMDNKSPIEPKLAPSVSLVQDPEKEVSGPIWVKGSIPIISSNGKKYEVRNRVTLCRCGRSVNKPFCDGAHIHEGFNDGDESLRRTR